MRPSLNLHAEVPRDLNQLRQHSQLGAMGVAEPKTQKPGAVAGFGIRVRRWRVAHYGKSNGKSPPCQHLCRFFSIFRVNYLPDRLLGLNIHFQNHGLELIP